MTPHTRAKVLEFLEFIITETGIHGDTEKLADTICAEAVKLREAIEAETPESQVAQP